MAWLQRNDDINPNARYHAQVQDYQHMVDKEPFMIFTIVVRRSDLILQSDT
jgi:hypothetical protein